MLFHLLPLSDNTKDAALYVIACSLPVCSITNMYFLLLYVAQSLNTDLIQVKALTSAYAYGLCTEDKIKSAGGYRYIFTVVCSVGQTPYCTIYTLNYDSINTVLLCSKCS